MSAAPKDGPTGLPFTFDMSETRVKSELPCDGTSGSFTGWLFSGFPTFGVFSQPQIPCSDFEHLTFGIGVGHPFSLGTLANTAHRGSRMASLASS